MQLEEYQAIKNQIINAGFAHEIQWAETVREPETAKDFFMEYAWVVINSGMKNQIAQGIWDIVQVGVFNNDCISLYFGHKSKVKAIKHVWNHRYDLLNEFQMSEDKLAFCKSLPWIGETTKFHLAKNFGVDCCKPDRHLVRLGEKYKTTPVELCSRLATLSGDRVATVDLVLWRASNLKFLQTH